MAPRRQPTTVTPPHVSQWVELDTAPRMKRPDLLVRWPPNHWAVAEGAAAGATSPRPNISAMLKSSELRVLVSRKASGGDPTSRFWSLLVVVPPDCLAGDQWLDLLGIAEPAGAFVLELAWRRPHTKELLLVSVLHATITSALDRQEWVVAGRPCDKENAVAVAREWLRAWRIRRTRSLWALPPMKGAATAIHRGRRVQLRARNFTPNGPPETWIWVELPDDIDPTDECALREFVQQNPVCRPTERGTFRLERDPGPVAEP